MQINDELTQFVQELGKARRIDHLQPTDNLLALGVVDSVAIVDLVAFLEKRFGISVADAEVVPENFRDIESLSRFVHAKMT